MTDTISRPAKSAALPGGSPPDGYNNPDPTNHSASPMVGASGRGKASRSAMADSTPTQHAPNGGQLTDRHGTRDDQSSLAVGDQPDQPATGNTAPDSSSLADPHLALAADVLDDIERVRVANANRLGALTRSTEDVDGRVRGYGLDETHPDVARLAAIVEMLTRIEHDATLNLQRRMRHHPLGPWLKSIRGVGDKQGARLLASIGGDPYIRSEHERADGTIVAEGPRTVSALWAMCGLHVVPADQESGDTQYAAVGGDGRGDPGQRTSAAHTAAAGVAPRRRRGQRANWSTEAKTRAHLVAKSCLRQNLGIREGGCFAGDVIDHLAGCECSPYRVVYDQRRAHTATTHPDWSDGHSHNDGLRVAAKAFLRDLWREAKRLHQA